MSLSFSVCPSIYQKGFVIVFKVARMKNRKNFVKSHVMMILMYAGRKFAMKMLPILVAFLSVPKFMGSVRCNAHAL